MDKLAWSNGIKPTRSHKSDNPNLKKSTIATEEDKAAQSVQAQPVQAPPVQAQPVQALEESHKQEEFSLNFNKALPGDYGLNNTSYEFSNNKREDSLTKSHTRYLVSRACSNPFLTHLNYVDDISNQAEFLIPKNSNM